MRCGMPVQDAQRDVRRTDEKIKKCILGQTGDFGYRILRKDMLSCYCKAFEDSDANAVKGEIRCREI